MTTSIDAALDSARTPVATSPLDLVLKQRGDRTPPVLRLACSDLNAECTTVLTGRTAEELLLQYVQHSFNCMHRTGPVDLDRVQSTITTA